MNIDERLFEVLDRCAPSQALSFHYVVDSGVVGFSAAFYNYANERTTVDGKLAFYDGKIHPTFPSSFGPIDVSRDDAPALLSQMVDRFISARDAASMAQEHNRKAQS
jgi:hypothetical protein